MLPFPQECPALLFLAKIPLMTHLTMHQHENGGELFGLEAGLVVIFAVQQAKI